MLATVAGSSTNSYAGGDVKEYRPSLWSGLYAGGSIGGAFADFGIIEDAFDNVKEFSNATGFRKTSNDSDTITGGVHIGYNIQKGKVVFGIEGDISFLNSELSAREEERITVGQDTFDYSEKESVNLEYLASLRGRIGVAGNKSLVYATAGVAFTEFNISSDEVESVNGEVFFSDSDSLSKSLTGLVVGGGLEYKLWQNTSLRGEVLHYMFDLEERDVKTDIDVTTAKVGVSYHF